MNKIGFAMLALATLGLSACGSNATPTPTVTVTQTVTSSPSGSPRTSTSASPSTSSSTSTSPSPSTSGSIKPSGSSSASAAPANCTNADINAALKSVGTSLQRYNCATVSGTPYAAVRGINGTAYFLKSENSVWVVQSADTICGTAKAGFPPELLAYCAA